MCPSSLPISAGVCMCSQSWASTPQHMHLLMSYDNVMMVHIMGTLDPGYPSVPNLSLVDAPRAHRAVCQPPLCWRPHHHQNLGPK